MMDSRIFASGESRAMGLYDVFWLGSLLGLSIGNILAVFHALGIVLWLIILMYSLVILSMVK